MKNAKNIKIKIMELKKSVEEYINKIEKEKNEQQLNLN